MVSPHKRRKRNISASAGSRRQQRGQGLCERRSRLSNVAELGLLSRGNLENVDLPVWKEKRWARNLFTHLLLLLLLIDQLLILKSPQGADGPPGSRGPRGEQVKVSLDATQQF